MSDLYRPTGINIDEVAAAVEFGVLVKVEPCKHGNYAPHICNIRETTKWGELETDWDNCDGTPEVSDV